VQPHRFLSEEEQRQQADIDGFLAEPAPEQVAVRLAKTASTLSQFKYINNERHLNEWLQTQKGDIRVDGWSAKKVDDQTYLVTYALVRDGKSEGVRFEVNLAAQLVRNVKGDPALEEKYSVN
jgi:type II secretory pathway component PulJ